MCSAGKNEQRDAPFLGDASDASTTMLKSRYPFQRALLSQELLEILSYIVSVMSSRAQSLVSYVFRLEEMPPS